MNSSLIKESVSLQQVAERFSIKTESKECPFPDCRSQKAFKVWDDRRFKCFKCGRSGSVYDLLIHTGHALNFQEAHRKLVQAFGNSDSSHQYQSRIKTIASIFRLYRSAALTHQNRTEDYCQARGWTSALTTHPIGYAPHGHYLRENGISTSTLNSLGLLTCKGEELYQHHLVWPVYNATGQIVHLCGRSLNPSDELRWLSSPGTPPVSRYLYNAPAIRDTDYCIVAEGVSDTYSLIQLGRPAVGTFGINASLLHHVETFGHLTHLIAFYDRDRYPLGHAKEGQYISWTQVLPHLVELACELKIPIFCCMVPDWPGIKDLNDYLVEIEYSNEVFNDYLRKSACSIHEMAYKVWINQPQHHDKVWRLHKAIPNSSQLDILRNSIELRYGDWTQYLLETYL